MPVQILPFPQELRPQLPTIVGNVDYLSLRRQLEEIDCPFVRKRCGSGLRPTRPGPLESDRCAGTQRAEQLKFQQRSRRALRCTILRTLLQEDYPRVQLPVGGQSPVSMVLSD